MADQGQNYLDGPIHSMAEFFEIRIKNLEKSILTSVPLTNKKMKISKKRKDVTFGGSEDEDSDKKEKAKIFASTTARVDILQANT